MKTHKCIFFKSEAAARRFLKLYGYESIVQRPEGNYFALKYFGSKVSGMYEVTVRADNEETKEWKLGEIKEKKWSGHKCYVFEG